MAKFMLIPMKEEDELVSKEYWSKIIRLFNFAQNALGIDLHISPSIKVIADKEETPKTINSSNI